MYYKISNRKNFFISFILITIFLLNSIYSFAAVDDDAWEVSLGSGNAIYGQSVVSDNNSNFPNDVEYYVQTAIITGTCSSMSCWTNCYHNGVYVGSASSSINSTASWVHNNYTYPKASGTYYMYSSHSATYNGTAYSGSTFAQITR
jgi:hypothetical protein